MKKLLLCLLLFWQIPQAFAQKAKSIEPELQKLKAAVAAAPEDTTRMMAYIQVGYYFVDTSQFDSALVYALKAEAIANRYPNYPKIANVWEILGDVYGNLVYSILSDKKVEYYGNQEKIYYQKAIEDAKRFGDEALFKRSWSNLNEALQSDNDIMPFYKSSLGLINYIETKSKLNSLDSLVLIIAYKRLCTSLDFDMGSLIYRKLLSSAKKLAKKGPYHHQNVSLFEFEQNARLYNKTSESRMLEDHNRLRTELSDERKKRLLSHLLALYYFNIKEYNKSLRTIHSFADSYQPNKDKYFDESTENLVEKYSLLGMNAYMMNRNSDAIVYLEQSLLHVEKIEKLSGMEYEKYQILLYLSKAHQKAGNYKKSYDYLTKANAQQEAFQSQQTQILIAENEVQIEQLKQEKKVHAAQTQTLLKEQEVRAVNRQRNILIVLFAAVLALAIWAVYNYRKSQKLGQQLAVQNNIIGQQAESLSESNQLKDKIFALLSHDLRTPINRLVVALGDSVQTQRMALAQELHNVQGVLNNVLYWSSMQVKGIKPHYAEVYLKMTIDQLLKEFEHQLEEKQLTALNAVEVGAKIWTDETYLKIILRNIISNAIKFTNSEGFIRINFKVDNNKVILTIKDTGIGMAADKLANLFQYPVSTLGTQLEIGTGLGLSLCYEMVKQLKGQLSVRSQEGQGTNVIIQLPI